MNTDTHALRVLDQFRQELYQRTLTRRRDALFELLEAVLSAPGPCTLVRLSLSPRFARRWPSVPDALDEGTVNADALRALVGARVPFPPAGERPVWACDGCVWPRPKAETSPERTYGHWTSAGIPQEGVIGCWDYQWLGVVPAANGSWFLPLDVARRGPQAGTPTALAVEQLRRAQAVLPPASPRPICTFDSNYDVTALAQAIQTAPPDQRLQLDAVVRLHPKRTFYRRPDPTADPGMGRRPIHGAPFKLPDPTTHGPPDQALCTRDPTHGVVTVSAWADLHPFGKAPLSLTIVRVAVEHLPKSGRQPQPLWLAWISPTPLDDLLAPWCWYRLRFVCEHGFRFFKQDLGWTTARPRWPNAADRWTWLLLLVVWHLWLAQDVVADQRLPWERPRPPDQLTPGRVRRAVGGILAGLSRPQAPLQPRGKSPGRALGVCPGRYQRYKVVKRAKTKPKTPT